MDIRYAIHPDHMKRLDTHEIRKHFLMEGLFEKDEMNMVYSHIDQNHRWRSMSRPIDDWN